MLKDKSQPDKNQNRLQRMFEEMGLGTDSERERFLQFGYQEKDYSKEESQRFIVYKSTTETEGEFLDAKLAQHIE